MDEKQFRILFVEDNPADIELTRESMAQAEILDHLVIEEVYDGEEALDFLHRRGRYQQAERPDLIFLDLNLPKKSGKEFLKEIKEDENLKAIPVIVLSSSGAEQDISLAYRLHANCYLRKPLGFQEFKRVMHALDIFWFSVVTLPTKSP